MRIDKKEIIKHMESYSPDVTDEYIYINPINNAAILAAVKKKIFNATGIPPYRLKITHVSTSTKQAKLAWVSLESAKTVQDIFRLSIQSNNRDFNVFPHVPGKAMKRHDALVNILKSLQEQNDQL